jgi:hypothetical protein
LTLREFRDSQESYNVNLLFSSSSYRILLLGNYTILDEGGNKIAVLERDEHNLERYRLRFQKPCFDGSADLIPVLQYSNNGEWTNTIEDPDEESDCRITPEAWNAGGRRGENVKDIVPSFLEAQAGYDVRIILKRWESDMPYKGAADRTTQYLEEETLTIGLNEDQSRIPLYAIRIPEQTSQNEA